MIRTIVFGALMTVGISSHSHSISSANVFSVLSKQNLYNGPGNIWRAKTTNYAMKKPTLGKMKYYNYYTASALCASQLKDLSCVYCQHFKNDVNEYAILRNSTHNTMALVTISNSRQEIVVTCRGSQSIWNFVLNFAFFDIKVNNMKIHTGYYIATMSLYNAVVRAVGYQRTRHPNYKIVLLGHSLGAAMARLTLFFLLQTNQFAGATYELYTYGEPRLGNKPFVDFFNALNIISARCVNKADVLPHISLTNTHLHDHYILPLTEFWITNGTQQRFCKQSFYEDSTCSNSLAPAYNFKDHLTYFGLDYAICLVRNPTLWLALPFGIFNTDDLPPLPKRITNFLAGLYYFVRG